MKVLIYGMQSSGATAFTFLMAQRKETVAILDLYCNELAPAIHCEKDVVLKCVASANFSLEQHLESFQPDKTILFTRNLDSVILSLNNKNYKDKCGTLETKIKLYQETIDRKELFDIELSYEDLLARDIDKVKFFIDGSAFDTPRSLSDIVSFNNEHCDWCRTWYHKKWHFGGLKANSKHVSIEDDVSIQRKLFA